MDTFWLTHGKLVTPRGIVPGAVQISGGRIAAIRASAPKGATQISVAGAHVAPGFIDLHIWGDPARVSREAAQAGCTAFLSAVGPEPPGKLLRRVAAKPGLAPKGASCLGFHLEGPFLNPLRAGALPKSWMRRPLKSELEKLGRAAGGRIRLMTLAPELPGASEAIRWCRARRIVASMGHSVAQAGEALDAVEAGARAVTHVFNGMPPFHHRHPSLLDIALTDARLTAMVILDGVHVSAHAFRLLFRTKGAGGVALVTDSIRHQGWNVSQRHGAYYTPRGVLAGSSLTMIRAVRNAVVSGGASLEDAVRMASETPATLLGLDRERGSLTVGRRADVTAFNASYHVKLTVVGGRIVYERD